MSSLMDPNYISIDILIQTITIFLGIATFIITHILEKRRDRIVANREIYQNLEFASIDLFRFEASNVDLIRPLWEERSPLPKINSAEYIAFFDYICQILNLFEMAIRFNKQKIVSSEVFGSWIIWYFEVCSAPNFALIWDEVKLNYTLDLREIISKGIEISKSKDNKNIQIANYFEFVGRKIKSRYIENYPIN